MILLSMLGEQPAPNLLPLWNSSEYTATQFAATQSTLPVAEMLSAAIRQDPALQKLEVLEPLVLDAYDIQKSRTALVEALNQYQKAERPARLNFTGGTKIMSLSALQAAFGTGTPLLYVASERSQILHFHSDGSEYRTETIQVKVSVAQYLRAHGLENSPNQNFREESYSDLRPRKEGDDLEEFIYQQLLHSNQFDDVQRGIFIRKKTQQGEVKNELDVLATLNGRLVVCSCKSGKIENDDLYELASLSQRERAGIYCGKVFAGAMNEFPPAFRDRAQSWKIQLIDGKGLNNTVATFLQAAA